MKRGLIIFILLLVFIIGIGIIIFILDPFSEKTNLEVKITTWSSFPGPNSEESFTHTIKVKEGEEFRVEQNILFVSKDEYHFKFIKRISLSEIKIEYNSIFKEDTEETSMNRGEFYRSNPSLESIITNEEKCFPTLTYDAGSIVCLKII
jgi:hypothetical protein